MSKPTYKLTDVEALYPKLDQPYRFDKTAGKNGKGGSVPCDADAKGAEYVTNFKMTGAQAKDLFKEMVAAYNEAKEDNWPDFTMPFTKDEDKMFIGKTRIDASYNSPPKHYDSANTPLDSGFQITTGSTISLFMQLIPYNGAMGKDVSLRRRAVQVLKYQEYVAASPFDTQEGFTQGCSSTTDDGLDDILGDVEEPKQEPEVIEEPTVKPSKKKKAEPAGDVDLASMLDAFDD